MEGWSGEVQCQSVLEDEGAMSPVNSRVEINAKPPCAINGGKIANFDSSTMCD